MKKEILSNEFCPENWDDMAKVKNGRFCSKCKINLTDLSEFTIEEIAKKHYGQGKCVALTNDQIDFIVNYKRIKSEVNNQVGVEIFNTGITFEGICSECKE